MAAPARAVQRIGFNFCSDRGWRVSARAWLWQSAREHVCRSPFRSGGAPCLPSLLANWESPHSPSPASFFYDFLFGRLEAFSASRVAIFVAAFGGLLLPTLLMGMSLPLLAKALARNIEIAATRIGLLYGVNTLGATAGAFGAGFLLIGMVGFEVAIYCAATINVAVGQQRSSPHASRCPILPRTRLCMRLVVRVPSGVGVF